MELENVKPNAELENEIAQYSQFEIVVDDQISLEVATEKVLDYSAVIKKVKEFWEEPIKQANALHKSLTAKRSSMLTPLEEKQSVLKAACSKYLTAIEMERREQQRKIDEAARLEEARLKKERDDEAARIQAEADKLAKAGKTSEAKILQEAAEEMKAEPVIVIPQETEIQVDKVTRTEAGSVSGRNDITVEVADMNEFLKAIIDGKIPASVITVENSKLKQYCKLMKVSGGFGLKIIEVVNASFRGKK